jgi:hypothetical protein
LAVPAERERETEREKLEFCGEERESIEEVKSGGQIWRPSVHVHLGLEPDDPCNDDEKEGLLGFDLGGRGSWWLRVGRGMGSPYARRRCSGSLYIRGALP